MATQKEACAQLHLTLLDLLNDKNPENAVYYARGLRYISICDEYVQFKAVESSFKYYVEKKEGAEGTMERIYNYTHDQRDIERVAQAMIGFRRSHQHMLEANLPWLYRVYYRSRVKTESIFAMIGMGATILAGGRGLATMVVRARARAHTLFR